MPTFAILTLALASVEQSIQSHHTIVPPTKGIVFETVDIDIQVRISNWQAANGTLSTFTLSLGLWR